MTRTGHQHPNGLQSNESARGDIDDKFIVEHITDTSLDQVQTVRRRREAPPLVKDLSSEERQRSEKALVRKIDLRLLPMLVLMYIMNCKCIG